MIQLRGLIASRPWLRQGGQMLCRRKNVTLLLVVAVTCVFIFYHTRAPQELKVIHRNAQGRDPEQLHRDSERQTLAGKIQIHNVVQVGDDSDGDIAVKDTRKVVTQSQIQTPVFKAVDKHVNRPDTLANKKGDFTYSGEISKFKHDNSGQKQMIGGEREERREFLQLNSNQDKTRKLEQEIPRVYSHGVLPGLKVITRAPKVTPAAPKVTPTAPKVTPVAPKVTPATPKSPPRRKDIDKEENPKLTTLKPDTGKHLIKTEIKTFKSDWQKMAPDQAVSDVRSASDNPHVTKINVDTEVKAGNVIGIDEQSQSSKQIVAKLEKSSENQVPNGKSEKSKKIPDGVKQQNFDENLAMLSPPTEAPSTGETAGKVVAKNMALSGYELPPGVEVVNHKVGDKSEGANNIHALLLRQGVIPNFPISDGMPRKLQLVANTWQVVQDSWEIYLFSAWWDDRETLDTPAVRVIAVAEEATRYVYCLHWYDGQLLPDAALADVTPVGPKIVPIGNKKYEQYMFSCNLAPKKGKPKYVSIITPNNVVPSTLLPVQEADKNPKETFEFGHCMSVVYWHHDPIRVVEWLELNKMFGVGEVTVYNNSLSDDVSAVFLRYQAEGYVDFRQAPNVIDHPSEYMILMNMSPAINDCLYRNMYRYKRVVCFDLDEVILPRGFQNYKELLEATDKKLNNTHPHQCYMFRNAYFFDDFKPVNEEPWFLWTQRYLKRVKPSQFGYSVKSITDPMTCVGLQNHVCWKRVPRYENTTWNVEVPPKFAMNQHYKRCHFDKYLKEEGACKKMMADVYMDKAAMKYGPLLYDRVAQKLLELDMADQADEKEKAEVVNKLKEANNDMQGLENALS